MRQSLHRTLVVLLALSACGLAGCGRGSSGGVTSASTGDKTTQLVCGKTTYRISADRIDSEVSAACERFRQSSEEMRSHSTARTRFTCKDGDGHVILSAPVPNELLDQYDRSCQQYLAADQPSHNGAGDRQAHIAALREFQVRERQLVTQTVDTANQTWRRNKADQASLNRLIRSRGGSIEIQD